MTPYFLEILLFAAYPCASVRLDEQGWEDREIWGRYIEAFVLLCDRLAAQYL